MDIVIFIIAVSLLLEVYSSLQFHCNINAYVEKTAMTYSIYLLYVLISEVWAGDFSLLRALISHKDNAIS